jgi:hypothetical protein
MPRHNQQELAASTSRNADGQSTGVDLWQENYASHAKHLAERAVCYLDCTVQTGTSLDVTIQDSPDNTKWYDVGSFAQVTAVGTKRLSIAGPLGRYVRAKWVIVAGGGAFTFSVTSELERPLQEPK